MNEKIRKILKNWRIILVITSISVMIIGTIMEDPVIEGSQILSENWLRIVLIPSIILSLLITEWILRRM